jgi:glycopeptide antibiotics resistance protein
MPARATSSRPEAVLTIVLAIVYAVLLVAIVVLKFPFNGPATDDPRVLNLVPFANSFGGRDGSGWSQVVENILVFVPFGIYLSMVRPGWGFLRRVVVIAATSAAFETIQYAFAIGRADITDVIDNTLGGVIGIALYLLVSKLLGRRTSRGLNILGIVATVAVLVLCLRLFTHDRSIPLI